MRAKDRRPIQCDLTGNAAGHYIGRALRIKRRDGSHVIVAERSQCGGCERKHDCPDYRRVIETKEMSDLMGRNRLHILSRAAAGIELRLGIEGNVALDNLSGKLSSAAMAVRGAGTIRRGCDCDRQCFGSAEGSITANKT